VPSPSEPAVDPSKQHPARLTPCLHACLQRLLPACCQPAANCCHSHFELLQGARGGEHLRAALGAGVNRDGAAGCPRRHLLGAEAPAVQHRDRGREGQGRAGGQSVAPAGICWEQKLLQCSCRGGTARSKWQKTESSRQKPGAMGDVNHEWKLSELTGSETRMSSGPARPCTLA